MVLNNRARRAIILLILMPVLLLNCNVWTPAPTKSPAATPTQAAAAVAAAETEPSGVLPTATQPPTPLSSQATLLPEPTDALSAVQVAGQPAPVDGEPAGCLSAEKQAAFVDERAMLGYADQLLDLPHSLERRVLPYNWNELDGSYSTETNILSLGVSDVQNQYLIQRMLNALQVAGFVTWLRDSSQQGLHILAISLRDPGVLKSAWGPYIQAYWQDAHSMLAGDSTIRPAMKLLPCRWMTERGLAPSVDASSWFNQSASLDYAAAGEKYLAADNAAAVTVAGKINWLGDAGREGPNTMCGPLAWAILNDTGALPPDWGGWSAGPVSFWLAKPRENGRPWSLFPQDSYTVTSFHDPLGAFDFSKFPLYPGDFIYTYSKGDGYDHMLVVTEIDAEGNVYTVTNIIHMNPVQKTTVERVLLLNLKDPGVGIARNQWAKDRVNGRTGHNGFDVFRWAWAEKNIQGQPVRYAVQPGDTLRLIALRWKTPVQSIAEYNGIIQDGSLSVGQELKIPPVDVLSEEQN